MKIYLKEKRQERNMTQLQLSLATDISESYISEIETGKYMPTIEVMCKLAKGLGCAVTDLFSCD